MALSDDDQAFYQDTYDLGANDPLSGGVYGAGYAGDAAGTAGAGAGAAGAAGASGGAAAMPWLGAIASVIAAQQQRRQRQRDQQTAIEMQRAQQLGTWRGPSGAS